MPLVWDPLRRRKIRNRKEGNQERRERRKTTTAKKKKKNKKKEESLGKSRNGEIWKAEIGFPDFYFQRFCFSFDVMILR
jgi:hypothetical protein